MTDDLKKDFWDDIEETLRSSVFRLKRAGEDYILMIPEEHGDHKEAIQIAVTGLCQTYDDLVWLLEPMRENYPNQLKGIHQKVFLLMQTSMIIGSSTMWSDSARDIFKRVGECDQAALAREENVEKAKARKIPLRQAIEKVCGNVELKRTRKFADSIREDVLKEMGVAPETRGYSSKTIQAEIRTILEERRKSLTHS